METFEDIKSLNFIIIPYPSIQLFTVCRYEGAERCPVLGIAVSTFVDKNAVC
jgi:hypothetical protein